MKLTTNAAKRMPLVMTKIVLSCGGLALGSIGDWRPVQASDLDPQILAAIDQEDVQTLEVLWVASKKKQVFSFLREPMGKKYLDYAIEGSKADSVAFLLTKEDDGLNLLDFVHTRKRRLLTAAARKGDAKVVQMLLTLGPCKKRAQANAHKSQALIEAASLGHLEVVKLLTSEGPRDSRALASAQEYGALMEAASNGHAEVVDYLIQREGDYSQFPLRPFQSCTLCAARAAILATENGHAHVVKILLKRASKEKEVDRLSYLRRCMHIAFLVAVTKRDLATVKVLLTVYQDHSIATLLNGLSTAYGHDDLEMAGLIIYYTRR